MSNICSECGEEVGDDEFLPDEDVCVLCNEFFLDQDAQREDEFEQSVVADSEAEDYDGH